MNANELPVTAALLNHWIAAHFTVFRGPPRSYFQLEFPMWIGWADEEKKTETVHTVSYLSLGFTGNEEECCRCLAAHLYICVTRAEWVDSCAPLFIRRDFSFEQDDSFGPQSYVTGRLAFWRTDKNRVLQTMPCSKPEGGLARRAVMPPNWFDRA